MSASTTRPVPRSIPLLLSIAARPDVWVASCRRDFRVKMWGTSSPDDKLTGDLGNVIETTQIGGRRSDRLTAGNLSPGNFGLLQHNLSEATVYRLLKDHGLITSPAFILMKASDRFANPTTAPNQLWQTDFTYLQVIGWGWFYLSTVLDDFSRYILAWKLCTTMSATDVSDTLQVALRGSGLNQVKVLHRPRLLSDNGPSYVSSELGKWLE